jgi:glucosyl-dolichyl phosphate glucuronosyltransferase
MPQLARPDLSVVVSTCNRRSMLRRALDALLDQRATDGLRYDVIIVDNGSTDGTRALVEAAAASSAGLVRYVFEPQRGVSFGRNAGVAVTDAPIVAFTDDDNAVAPDWVATIVRLLAEHPDADAVGGRVLPEWPDDVPRWITGEHWSPLAILDYGDASFFTSDRDPRCLLTANLAFRREVFTRLGGFSPEFVRCQDHELLTRLWRAGGRALYAPGLVVRAPIERSRLTRRYHQAWHARHGYFAARLRAEEMVDASGCLTPPSAGARRAFGVPPHVFAEVARALWRSLAAAARGDWSGALRRVFHARYLCGYIRGTLQQSRAAPGVTMGTPRLAFVHALLAVVIGGSLYDIRTGREHWPLSPYPMFSIVDREPTVKCLRIVGIAAGRDREEIPLLDADVIRPFDQCRLTSALSRTFHDPARRDLVHEQLRDCLARYEARRLKGEHEGPPLSGVRLYEMQWTLDGDAANVTTPDTRRLIDTVDASAAHGL